MRNNNIPVIILLILIIIAPSGCVRTDAPASAIDEKQVTAVLDDGILMVPIEGKTVSIYKPFDPENVTEIPATAYFSGTVDKNNSVILEGIITIGGENETVRLSGNAGKVFSGWNVPDGAKPIEKKVGTTTLTRYEGATRKYTTYVNVQDENGEYVLQGQFLEDNHGGFIGTIVRDGKECIIALRGNSSSFCENVTLINTTEAEEELEA
ncbi:hypothetical protein [Methanolobus profundi]|uniref:Uncharacterized protein n=1 Tax=Methanolobus profundi TaxID=487685 RepID=A0A1I4REE0_9EURY|nr:hypothetical protein [Methanolobus profundi]SFM50575.1 hypothetical protein SAMN04488696_1526 [Methanolobus profundi]